MLLAIAAGAYCTLTYTAGYYFFKMKEPTKLSVPCWLLSPITVPGVVAAVLLIE